MLLLYHIKFRAQSIYIHIFLPLRTNPHLNALAARGKGAKPLAKYDTQHFVQYDIIIAFEILGETGIDFVIELPNISTILFKADT